jgi:hypothetical protein
MMVKRRKFYEKKNQIHEILKFNVDDDDDDAEDDDDEDDDEEDGN